MLRSKRPMGFRPPSTCGKSEENSATDGPELAIVQPVSSCGYGVARIWRVHVLARFRLHALEPLLVLAERLVRGVEHAHPTRQPRRAELDDADAEVRDATAAHRR